MKLAPRLPVFLVCLVIALGCGKGTEHASKQAEPGIVDLPITTESSPASVPAINSKPLAAPSEPKQQIPTVTEGTKPIPMVPVSSGTDCDPVLKSLLLDKSTIHYTHKGYIDYQFGMAMPPTHKESTWSVPPNSNPRITHRFSEAAVQNYERTEQRDWRFASEKNEAMLFDAGRLKGVSKLYFGDNAGYLSSLTKEFGPAPKSLTWNIIYNYKPKTGNNERLHIEAACWATDDVIIGVSAQKGSEFTATRVASEEFVEVCVFDRKYFLLEANAQLTEYRKLLDKNARKITEPKDETEILIACDKGLPVYSKYDRYYGPFQFLFESMYAQILCDIFPPANGHAKFNVVRNELSGGDSGTYFFRDFIKIPAYEWTNKDDYTVYLSNSYIKFVKERRKSLK